MVRTHTLVEFRRKQHELELALRGLEQQEEVDYKLDVEFYLRLEALARSMATRSLRYLIFLSPGTKLRWQCKRYRSWE